MDIGKVDEIIDRHGAAQSSLLAILQDIQDEANYLPREALDRVTERLGVPESRVYGMATFFKAFSLKERGKHVCQVCLGTACHVRGGDRLVDEFSRKLQIGVGETTNDKSFTLETVNCVGACALGPVVVMDGKYHGSMSTGKVEKLLSEYGFGKEAGNDDAE